MLQMFILRKIQRPQRLETLAGKSHLLADLRHPVPARALDRRADELGADIALAQILFIYRSAANSCLLLNKI